MIYGDTQNILHADGISEYYIDRASGLIAKHRVSHYATHLFIIINNHPVSPREGIFNALVEEVAGVPVLFHLERIGGNCRERT
mmetsp:Transcript_1067/g.2601  ORF Transcript_1067/g.2601 Transcript_1067/m.2601 type:complete len:83 (+) Transcript_1067:321-569(+)